MRIAALPESPREKAGWHWSVESSPASETSPNRQLYPRISIVTPSYNQGEFIERTIRSVLQQGYPNLEYIIIDGGSTDDSLSIIKKYEKHLTYWVSEPDHGQSDAINKGLRVATGRILCWLNSDDFYLPDTLKVVAENLNEGSGKFALMGHVLRVYTDGRPAQILKGKYENRRRLLQFWRGYHMHQSSIFWRREVFERVGFLDENQHYVMDFDYWVRIAEHYDFTLIDRVLSCATFHSQAKTGDDYVRYHRELRAHSPKFWGTRRSVAYWRLKFSMTKHDVFTLLIKVVKAFIKNGKGFISAIKRTGLSKMSR